MMHEKCLSRKIAVAFALCESSEKSRSNAKAAKTLWLKITKDKIRNFKAFHYKKNVKNRKISL